MKMLIIEYSDGTADCEPYIPMPGQDALIADKRLNTPLVESELLALSYLDKPQDLKIDDGAIKKKVIKALELSNWVQKDAAKLVGISPRSFHYHCKRFEIVCKKWTQVGNKKPRLKIAKRRRQA